MASMLLLNPRRRRRKAKSANPRKRRARKANPLFARKRTRRSRRRNALMVNTMHRRRRSRRANPLRMRRRRRNPLGGMAGGFMGFLMDAGIFAAGAVGFDLAYGQINQYLPASIQVNTQSVGAGDAVKLVATVAVGTVGAKALGSKGAILRKLMVGAAAGQLRDIVTSMMPNSTTPGIAGMGFYNPGSVINAQFWAKPNRNIRGAGMSALLPAGSSSRAMHGAPRMGALLRPGARTGAQAVSRGPGARLASVYSPRASGLSTSG